MSLEVVVRPVVMPNIRPSEARRIAPPDDPATGICSLGGGGGGTFVGVSKNYSHSISKQKPHVEKKRQGDVERIYQMDDDGNVNQANFVDVVRTKKIRMDQEDGTTQNLIYGKYPAGPNVEIRNFNKNFLAPDIPDNWG